MKFTFKLLQANSACMSWLNVRLIYINEWHLFLPFCICNHLCIPGEKQRSFVRYYVANPGVVWFDLPRGR